MLFNTRQSSKSIFLALSNLQYTKLLFRFILRLNAVSEVLQKAEDGRRPEIRRGSSRAMGNVPGKRRQGWRTCKADEARALFRMNFYEISQHKTRSSPIGTYVRTLHPDDLLLLLLLLLLSINRPGTGWHQDGKR